MVAAVVARALDDGLRVGVTHAEALARAAVAEELAARRACLGVGLRSGLGLGLGLGLGRAPPMGWRRTMCNYAKTMHTP